MEKYKITIEKWKIFWYNIVNKGVVSTECAMYTNNPGFYPGDILIDETYLLLRIGIVFFIYLHNAHNSIKYDY